VILNLIVLWLTLQSSSRPQTFVTIHADVKPNKETFVVHKNLICHHSPFFKTAFNSLIEEGRTQTMTLEDVEIGVFILLVNWLYTQKVEDAEEPYVKVAELAKLWNLAQ
jgi:hypothetical protein